VELPRRGESISPDGHVAIVRGGAGADTAEMVRAADRVQRHLEASAPSGVRLALTGSAALWSQFNDENKAAMLRSEITSWPLTLAVLLVAFGSVAAAGIPLLTSVRDEFERTGNERGAIVEGLARSGRVINAAGAVMIVVFFTFALSRPLPPKEMGVILGVAVLLDTMVRVALATCSVAVARSSRLVGPVENRPMAARDSPSPRRAGDAISAVERQRAAPALRALVAR
jgi:uncharacterized membrane protein YdfJ with MMPL/SSD domain